MNTEKSIARLSQTIERIDGAYAPSTIRAYQANFMRLIDYCESIQAEALPAAPRTVAAFVDKLCEDKFQSATIRQIVASIASIHTLNNYPNPTQHSEVKIAIKRMHRKIGRFSQQAYGINKELLNEMLEVTDDSLRGLRDRALLLVAYDTMCRRSELVSFMVDDIDIQVIDRRHATQSMVIFIEQSKTDQEANGKWLKLSEETASALKAWIRCSGIKDGRLFRGVNMANMITDGLTTGQICKIYKGLARKAEFGEEFVKHVSGHSMRVGAAQDLLLSGATLPMMMAKGRWTKPDTVMRYVEKVGIPI